jgi:hypothetical protein
MAAAFLAPRAPRGGLILFFWPELAPFLSPSQNQRCGAAGQFKNRLGFVLAIKK